MKKRILSVVLVISLLLIIPVSVFTAAFGIPAQFDETYYGELPYLYRRLEAAKGRKIIIIGGSGVAFGLLPELLEQEFPDYQVNLFGLYGVIGTETMMLLAKESVKKGDIVILLPEQSQHTLSTYFSPLEFLRAADGEPKMLLQLAQDKLGSLAGNLSTFASEKFRYYLAGEKPGVTGVYTQSSFLDAEGQEVGYMTYFRSHNTMVGGYDRTDPISYDAQVVDPEFVALVNDYASFVRSSGAVLYFGFAPVNRLAVISDDDEMQEYYAALQQELSCPLLGHPKQVQFDFEWFYDNNHHMNSAGMAVYTAYLAEALKASLGDSSTTRITIPEKPTVPLTNGSEAGNNEDADCFTYGEISGVWAVTGLTELGVGQNCLTIPTEANGKPIEMIAQGAFSSHNGLQELTIPETIRYIEDASFTGCIHLTKLILCHQSPESCTIGTGLLSGAENCYLYIPIKSLASFTGGCTGWSNYSGRMIGY